MRSNGPLHQVELGTITASDSVAMMEVSILRDVTIASPGNFRSVS